MNTARALLCCLLACPFIGCAETSEPGEVPITDIQDTAPAADILAPTWPADAALVVTAAYEDKLTIAWPSAIDDTSVAGYQVFEGSILRAEVHAGYTSHTLWGLKSFKEYVFKVRAVDAAGNVSAALHLQARAADLTAPTWALDAAVIVGTVTETTAVLSWSPADDNAGAVTYWVMNGDTVLMAIKEVNAILTELNAWTHYTLQVRAVDGAGNVSDGGPNASFKTTDETDPLFEEGAALQSSNVSPQSVTLTWPAATDNVQVSGYQLLRNMVLVAETDGSTLTATVEGLSPSASYSFSVRALDPAGNHSQNGPTATISTTDESAPTWPDGAAIALSNIQPTSVTLAWSPADDDVAVTVYRVMQNGVEVAAVSDTKTNISGLSSWSDYTFTVAAEDGAGNASLDTLDVELHTPDHSPPTWAEGDALVVSDLTADSLTLSWPAATDDAAIAGYTLYQDEAMLTELGPDITTHNVAGLSPWTDYTFRVETADLAGNPGANSVTASTQTLDTSTPTWPAGLLTVSNSTPYALTLTWTAAADDVAVTQYQIMQDGVVLDTVDGTTTSLDVTALSPWTDYDFGVEAADAAGNWSQSGPSASLTTPDTVDPTWPADAVLTVSNLQSTSLALSWPAATDDVGIASYVITVDGGEAMTVDGALTIATVPNLSPTETYLLTVVAVDPAGNQSTSLNVTETTPDGGPPLWPGGKLSASGVSNYSVVLSWTPAVDDVGVTGYRVFQDGTQVGEPTGTQFEVNNLDPAIGYDFKVEAGDAAGNWSTTGPSVSVTTTKVYDPGFMRLSKEQYNRTLADLMAQYKELYCGGCNSWFACNSYGFGCKTWPFASSWYSLFTIKEWGMWDDYRRLYMNDNVEPAPGELRGGYRRFDQVVHNEHVTSWIQAAMKVAHAYFDDDLFNTNLSYYGYNTEGDLGHGDRILFKPCEKAYDNGSTTFETEAAMYEACVSDFITDFGLRAYRQPLSDAEHAYLLGIYQAVDQQYVEADFIDEVLNKESSLAFNRASRGLRNVLAVLLTAPKFLYRVELGDENGHLTAYELASRLSYHFWNSMPDTELFAAAADGSLMTEEGYQAQVERLFQSPKSEPVIREFYRDYLRVEEHPDLRFQDGFGADDRRYQLGANIGKTGHPISTKWNTYRGIKEASQLEMANLGLWFTQTQPGTFEEMFRSNQHFLQCQVDSQGNCKIRGAEVWGLYIYGTTAGEDTDSHIADPWGWTIGVHGWDGVSEPITFPEPERAGLITRIGFLAHQSMTARPIRRGLKIQEMLLCNPIPPPENCDVVRPPVVTGICEGPEGTTGVSCSADTHCGAGETCVGWDKEVTMTVREKVEELTEDPDYSCIQCHGSFINGFGHALGHFSSEGRYWEKEHMFTTEKKSDGSGSFKFVMDEPENWPAIDATGTSILNGQMVTVDGALDLADALVESGQMEWCWSREYFRFAMGRVEWDVDAEAIETLAQSLRDGATLADGFNAIAHLPQFKTLNKPKKPAPTGDTP